MKVLITGYSGFLGQIVTGALSNYDIIKIGRHFKADIIADLSTNIPAIPACSVVIHIAGKAHSVPKTLQQIQSFFTVNILGTNNLLKGLERAPSLPRSFVFISSVAVYGQPSGISINENEPLSANDPYGQSKIQAEELIQTWCKKHNVICTILRLPLVAGPNPPGNLGSMIKGIQKGYYFNIDGGKARKSIVLAEDVARIIPKAAEVGGIYNLTDGYHPSFRELGSVIAQQLNKKNPANVPGWLAKAVSRVGDMLGNKAPLNSDKLKKITSDLTFDDSRARNFLGWNPTPVLKGFKIC